MTPEQILMNYYLKSEDIADIKTTKDNILFIDHVANRISQNKAVYTVLITLAVYKIYEPRQDIRLHKTELKGGFSARSFDTKHITPVLQQLEFPAMSESGWLTRSIEQLAPFDSDFPGRITPAYLKVAFLGLVAEIQNGGKHTENILRLLLNKGIIFSQANKVEITKINNPDIRIDKIIALLREHFTAKYNAHGGAKLPMLAFYAMYQVLVSELIRFKNCELLPMGSLTACDETSKSAGDIAVKNKSDGNIFEAIEIKLNRPVTPTIVRNAYSKINKFRVNRYYILSGAESSTKDLAEINSLISKAQAEQGCQIIVNGLYQSLKYYLRLIQTPQEFINNYIKLVESDKELEKIHKDKLTELIKKLS